MLEEVLLAVLALLGNVSRSSLCGRRCATTMPCSHLFMFPWRWILCLHRVLLFHLFSSVFFCCYLPLVGPLHKPLLLMGEAVRVARRSRWLQRKIIGAVLQRR